LTPTIAIGSANYLPTITDEINWNAKQASGLCVTSVSASGGLYSSGGLTPTISVASTNYLPTPSDQTNWNAKQSSGVCLTNISVGSGLATTGGLTPTLSVASGYYLPTQSLNTTSSPTFANITDSALTQGSVLFAGTSGLLSQDNANYFWDATNKRLGIGTNTPIAKIHEVTNQSLFTSHIAGTTYQDYYWSSTNNVTGATSFCENINLSTINDGIYSGGFRGVPSPSGGWLQLDTGALGGVAQNFITINITANGGGFGFPWNLQWSDGLSAAISAATWTSNVATITTTNAFVTPLAIGMQVCISGVTPTGYNGTWVVTGVNTGTNTFTFALTSNPGTGTVFGSVIAGTGVWNTITFTSCNWPAVISTPTILNTNSSGTSLQASWTSVGTHRYWRFLNEGTTINSSYVQEFQFATDNAPYLTLGNVTSLGLTGITTPTLGGLQFSQNGTIVNTMGCDPTDSNKFKVGTTSLATNTMLALSTAGSMGLGNPGTLSGVITIMANNWEPNSNTYLGNPSYSMLNMIDNSSNGGSIQQLNFHMVGPSPNVGAAVFASQNANGYQPCAGSFLWGMRPLGSTSAPVEVMRLDSYGRLGIGHGAIGLNSQTAMLQLGGYPVSMSAGAVGTSPLKFTSGTLLASAEAGAVEFDGTHLYFSPSTTRNVFAISPTTGISTTIITASLTGSGVQGSMTFVNGVLTAQVQAT
jgi:hypothetical protein